MEEIKIGFFGLVVANIILGLLFGTFPLVAGLLSGNRKYSFIGFVVTVAGGAILGIFLSYPLAMLFLWLILKTPKTEELGEDASLNAEAETETI